MAHVVFHHGRRLRHRRDGAFDSSKRPPSSKRAYAMVGFRLPAPRTRGHSPDTSGPNRPLTMPMRCCFADRQTGLSLQLRSTVISEDKKCGFAAV